MASFKKLRKKLSDEEMNLIVAEIGDGMDKLNLFKQLD